MRRMIYSFLGFVGIFLGIALVIPFFLTINDYKPQIQAEATKALGRDVLIDGGLSLSFLPRPQFTIHKVRIVNMTGGTSQDFLNIKQIRVAVSLFPLLKKHVKINSLELDQPEIYLEKLGDGRTNWTFPALSAPSASSSSETVPSSSNFEVNFEKIKITNGHLVYLAKGQGIKIQNMNIHAKIASLQGPYAIEGTLSAYDRDIQIEGALGTPEDPEHAHLKIQVDGATSTFDGKLSLSALTFKGSLKAAVDPKMVKNLSSNDKALPFLTDMLRMEADVMANAEGISLNKAQFEVGAAHPTGDLKILLKNGFKVEGILKDIPGQSQAAFTLLPSDQGLKGALKATIPNTKELLEWLMVETSAFPPSLFSPLTLSTQYAFGDDISLKDLKLMMGEAKLQGNVAWQSEKSGSMIAIDLETPKIENILKLLGAKDPKHLGTSKLKGKVQVGSTHLNLTNLKGQLGANLTFAGDVAVDYKAKKPQMKAVLSVNSINMDVLLASRQTQNFPFSNGQLFFVSTKGKQHPAHTGPRWSHEPLDFGFLEKFDGQFEVSSSKLSQKDIVVTNPKLIAKLQNGRLDVSSLTGAIYGGMFRASGHLTADNTMHFHVLLQDANLKQLFSQGTNIKIIAGKLTLSSDLSTHGKSMFDMVQHLSGPVTIRAKEGVVNGFDLQAISQRLGNLQNIQSVLGLLTTSMAKGQTPFSSFNGDIAFTEGVGKIQTMNLVAQGGQGQASGQIDLPRYTMDVRSEFHLTDLPKLPPFQMHLSGPLDNPSRHVDATALQRYMMENVFKGVIENLGKGKIKPADMLNSLLGKNKGEQPAPQQQGKAGPLDKPEKIMKDIFKGIF